MRRTARRYSLCVDDADDAYQRAVEIMLTKSPPADLRHLVAWMQVVTRREALAVRRSRERLLDPSGDDHADPLDRIACDAPGPQEVLERREQLADAVRLLMELKPQERLALVLQAQGYSYAETCGLCGWTYTKPENQPADLPNAALRAERERHPRCRRVQLWLNFGRQTPGPGRGSQSRPSTISFARDHSSGGTMR